MDDSPLRSQRRRLLAAIFGSPLVAAFAIGPGVTAAQSPPRTATVTRLPDVAVTRSYQSVTTPAGSAPAPAPADEATRFRLDNELRLRGLATNNGFGYPVAAVTPYPLPAPTARTVDTGISATGISATGISATSGAQDLSQQAMVDRIVNDAPSPLAAIHSRQLRDKAHHSLAAVHDSLRKGAIRTASRDATDALRWITAYRDSLDNTTESTERLQVALDAIREAEDFCGKFGTVDTASLRRMVQSHLTTALKQRDLSDVSPVKAAEIYFAVAKENLIVAGGGMPEAGDAMVLLGRASGRMKTGESIYHDAVALTLQRAAVETSPRSPLARRELGQTLLSQGLVAQAAAELHASHRLQPTRTTYELLLTASRRLGDTQTAAWCVAALNDPATPSDFPMRVLTPQQFLAMSPRPAAPPAATTPATSGNDTANRVATPQPSNRGFFRR